MKSLDTSVLARFFINDPDDQGAARQRPAAAAAMAERGFIPVKVLLEFEWAMRGFYALPCAQISRALRALAGVNHLVLEDREMALNALDHYDPGLDFADALHLARSKRATAMVTFAQRLAKHAKMPALQPAVELLESIAK